MGEFVSNEICESCGVSDSRHRVKKVMIDCLKLQLEEEREVARKLKALLYRLDPEWDTADLKRDDNG